MKIRREEHMAGGNGHVIIKEILDAEQLNGKCGQGEYNDNGTYRPVKAGDITFTPDNHGHALANTGNTDLVFMALIIKD